jgi:hypothetical protein
MPVYTIETPSGRTLEIEAADEATALRGAQEWHAQQGQQQQPQQPKDTGFLGAAQQGVKNLIGGVGETLKQYTGATETGEALKRAGETAGPSNYEPAQVIAPQTSPDQGILDRLQLSQVPRAVVEQAPNMAAAIAAARLGARFGVIPGLLSGAGAYATTALGNRAVDRAQARTGEENAEPTTSDKAIAAGAMIPEAALGTLGLARFLPGAARAAGVGLAGATSAAKEAGKTALIEGATEAGQNVIEQTGRTIGTDQGVRVDPAEVAASGIVGGATGGTFAAPKAARDAVVSARLAEFGGENAEASAAVANRLIEKAGGDATDLRGKTAYAAIRDTKTDLTNELDTQVKDLKARVSLDEDTDNALNRATMGRQITQADQSRIDQNVGGDPAADRVKALVRQITVLDRIQKKGDFNNTTETFQGGVSNKLEKAVQVVSNPWAPALTAGAALAGLGTAGIATYSPYALGAIAGVYGGARGIDAFTGARDPAKQFAERFGDGTTNFRPEAQEPPRDAVSPTGPKIAQRPEPWGAEPPAEERYNPRANLMVDEGIARITKRIGQDNKKRVVDTALPLLRQLAEIEAQRVAAEEEAARAAQVQQQPLGPSGLPKDVVSQTQALVKALASMQKLKEQTLGANQAEAAAAASPVVSAAGGLDAVSNPAAGKRASEILSTISAMRRLSGEEGADVAPKKRRSDKAEAAPGVEEAPIPADLKYTKINDQDRAIAEQAATEFAQSGDKPKVVIDRYRQSTEKRQARIRDRLMQMSADPRFPEDSLELEAALDGVRTVRRRESLEDYVNDLVAQFPQHGELIRAYLGQKWAKTVWNPTPKEKRKKP